jgi:hypothetical protein
MGAEVYPQVRKYSIFAGEASKISVIPAKAVKLGIQAACCLPA